MTGSAITAAGTNLTWELPAARTSGDVRPDRRRVGDFRDLRRCVPVLRWQESDGTHATGRSASPDLLFDLSALQQPDHSPGRASPSKRKDSAVSGTGGSAPSRWASTFLFGTAREWYRLIYRGWPDDQHESVRHDLLFAGRPARLPCDCWTHPPLHSHGVHHSRARDTRANIPASMCCLSIGISWMQCGSWSSRSFTSSDVS